MEKRDKYAIKLLMRKKLISGSKIVRKKKNGTVSSWVEMLRGKKISENKLKSWGRLTLKPNKMVNGLRFYSAFSVRGIQSTFHLSFTRLCTFTDTKNNPEKQWKGASTQLIQYSSLSIFSFFSDIFYSTFSNHEVGFWLLKKIWKLFSM